MSEVTREQVDDYIWAIRDGQLTYGQDADRHRQLCDYIETLTKKVDDALFDRAIANSLAECEQRKATHLEQRLAAIPVAPAWSQEAPKVEGYYWFKVPRAEAELYKVFETSSGGFAIESGGEVYGVERFDGFWCPIVPPEGTR